MLRIALAAIMLVAFAPPAQSNSARGGVVAFSVCATCHAVARGGGASPNAMAPRFADVANWPGMNDRALRVWLQSSHPTMPNFILNRDDTDAIVEYILSLKKKH